jgi:precorrin-6A/cobalt-precorrin-6A reductase
MRLLILGGTSEASALARRVADERDIAALLSLAGATANPAKTPISLRIGGFGGAGGLADFLRAERIDAVIDATHPFAERMSANALAATRSTCTPMVVFTREPWVPQAGDRWTEVLTMDEAAAALGRKRKSVFLTQGKLQLAAFARAPQHRYLVRTIDPPSGVDALPDCKLILARGPFGLDDELTLMRDEKIEALVTKNSGGLATYPKIEAARLLGIQVVILRRPKPPDAETLHDLEAAMAWIAAHRAAP